MNVNEDEEHSATNNQLHKIATTPSQNRFQTSAKSQFFKQETPNFDKKLPSESNRSSQNSRVDNQSKPPEKQAAAKEPVQDKQQPQAEKEPGQGKQQPQAEKESGQDKQQPQAEKEPENWEDEYYEENEFEKDEDIDELML